MEKYTIYCTEEQTKKALELGAPIETHIHIEPEYSMANGCLPYPEEYEMLKHPTAEQMIGWLSEKMGITTFLINYYPVHEKYGYLINARPCVLEASFNRGFKTRKEAILAAIDAALGALFVLSIFKNEDK